MSIRAYKIEKIRLKSSPTFNVGENYDWLNNLANCNYNEDGECKMMEFQKDDVMKKIKTEQNENRCEILQAIIKDCDDNDEVEYSCY